MKEALLSRVEVAGTPSAKGRATKYDDEMIHLQGNNLVNLFDQNWFSE